MKKNNKQKQLNAIPLEKYEEELIDFLEKGEFVSDPKFKQDKKMFEEAAKRHAELQKSKSITLRIKNVDLIKIKAKASKNNIPYQSLIGLLINKYIKRETKINI